MHGVLFQGDFSLMCENATIYNRPETIYYKAAKRLHAVGLKCMTKVRTSSLIFLISSCPPPPIFLEMLTTQVQHMYIDVHKNLLLLVLGL